jgi:thiosulfate dehydrogenase [quinone] large subunit
MLAARERRPPPRRGEPAVSRREVLVRALGLAGVASLGIAGLSALAKGSYHGRRSLASLGKPKAAAAPAQATPPPSASQRPALPQGAVRLGPAKRLPRGQGATYRDPGDGSPDIVIRGNNGKLTAFSAVCTHAGCTVGYEGGQLVCPCHGGTFDAHTGQVISGPPPQALAVRHVVESGGQIYAVPS